MQVCSHNFNYWKSSMGLRITDLIIFFFSDEMHPDLNLFWRITSTNQLAIIHLIFFILLSNHPALLLSSIETLNAEVSPVKLFCSWFGTGCELR